MDYEYSIGRVSPHLSLRGRNCDVAGIKDTLLISYTAPDGKRQAMNINVLEEALRNSGNIGEQYQPHLYLRTIEGLISFQALNRIISHLRNYIPASRSIDPAEKNPEYDPREAVCLFNRSLIPLLPEAGPIKPTLGTGTRANTAPPIGTHVN